MLLGTFSDNIDFCESQFTRVVVQVHNPWFCVFFSIGLHLHKSCQVRESSNSVEDKGS